MSNTHDFVVENGVLTKYVGSAKEVSIPNGITEIGEFAFCENRTTVKIDVPEGVTSIGRNAFDTLSWAAFTEIRPDLINKNRDDNTIAIPISFETFFKYFIK